jgi:hypothetical protein
LCEAACSSENKGPYFLGVTHYSYGEGALAHSTVKAAIVLTLTHHMGEGPYFFIGTESLTIHMVRPGGARLLRRGVTHYSYGEGA